MKRRAFLAAALSTAYAIGGAIGAAPSVAQTTPGTPVVSPVVPGFFYWSIGTSGGVRHLPRWSYGNVLQFTNMGATLDSGYRYSPRPVGAGSEFVMGYALNKAGPLGGIGDVPRIELGLSSFFGRTSGSDALGGQSDLVLIPFIDGSDGLAFAGQSVSAKLQTSVYAGEAALRFKTAFKISPRFQIAPSIAAIGGMAFYRYKWGIGFSPDVGQTYSMDVKETVRSWQVGAEAAVQFLWQPALRWRFHGGAAIAAMYRNSSMRGRSQTTQMTASFNETVVHEASDNAGAFVWRLGLTAGVTYDWGWARLSISGFGYYDSKVPGIDNPSYSPTNFTQASRARLIHSGEWAYGGRIALIFPISTGR